MPPITTLSKRKTIGDRPLFISCTTCRIRKVKCSGERPTCSNCSKRGSECHYDSEIKRRGPDKRPGGRLKPKGTFVQQTFTQKDEDHSDCREGTVVATRIVLSSNDDDDLNHVGVGSNYRYHPSTVGSSSQLGSNSNAGSSKEGDIRLSTISHDRRYRQIGQVRDNDEDEKRTFANEIGFEDGIPMYTPPGEAKFAREDLWTRVLEEFSNNPMVAKNLIMEECSAFFAENHLWHIFLHRAYFFQRLHTAETFAPHLVLGMLAHTTFLKQGRTNTGQLRALQFADKAQHMINHQLVAGSKDPTLAQAALLLATFETQPHVLHSPARQLAAMGLVDICVRACLPTQMDKGKPGASFDLLSLPRVEEFSIPSYTGSGSSTAPNLRKWAVEPLWSNQWSTAEIQKEEIRRTCWCASHVAASVAIFRIVHGRAPPRISVSDPSKFALLFPGEAVFQERGQAHLGKTSIWALCYRATSLWFAVNSGQLSPQDIDRAVYQARSIENDAVMFTKYVELLNAVWTARDWALAVLKRLHYLEPARISIWFKSQRQIMFAFAHQVPGVPRIADRPMFAWWYLLQGYAALEFASVDPILWNEADTILDYVYEAMDNATSVWPCQDLEHLHRSLKKAHKAAKMIATVEPFPMPGLEVPSIPSL